MHVLLCSFDHERSKDRANQRFARRDKYPPSGPRKACISRGRLDGTPLFDTKVYFPQFACLEVTRCRWLRDRDLRDAKANNSSERKRRGSP